MVEKAKKVTTTISMYCPIVTMNCLNRIIFKRLSNHIKRVIPMEEVIGINDTYHITCSHSYTLVDGIIQPLVRLRYPAHTTLEFRFILFQDIKSIDGFYKLYKKNYVTIANNGKLFLCLNLSDNTFCLLEYDGKLIRYFTFNSSFEYL